MSLSHRTGPHAQKGPALRSRLCGYHLRILNHFEEGCLYYQFALGPADYVMSSTWGFGSTRGGRRNLIGVVALREEDVISKLGHVDAV